MLLTQQQNEEIEQQRSNPQPTLRAVSEGMESRLYKACLLYTSPSPRD